MLNFSKKIEKNNTWRAYVISRNDIQNYKFDNIDNLICFPYTNEKIYENCFNNKNINIFKHKINSYTL